MVLVLDQHPAKGAIAPPPAPPKPMNFLTASIAKLKRSLGALSRVDARFAALHEQLNERMDEMRFAQGLVLASLHEHRTSPRIQDYEFKVFSQWGEDGILQYLTRVIPITHKTFLEFGVGNFFESNCRYLMAKDNWRGLVIDGSAANMAQLKRSSFYWKHHLIAVDAFITKDNINALLAQSQFDADVGILSVDLDGNDYFVLDAIDTFTPRILICEYNAVFGPTRTISVPYDPSFDRTRAHSSNLYWGASLPAMTYLANKRGYSLVGTNAAANNAFYVRNDLLNARVEVLTAEQAHAPSLYRESVDTQGAFTFLAGDERLAAIQGMPVFNVEQGVIEPL